MSTKIAVIHRRAAGIMFDHGLSEDDVLRGLKEIKQPSKDYYYVSDVMKFVYKIKTGE